jgi:hypothetical protein
MAAVESLESRFLLSAALDKFLQQNVQLPIIVKTAGTSLTAPFTPAQIQKAYGLNQLTDQGNGQTIAIIDPYNDPNILTDANTFSGSYSLQTFNTGGPTFTVENEFGQTNNLPPDDSLTGGAGSGADVEESLDVEWAHTVAPMANILVIELNSFSNADVFQGVQTAASSPGVSEVSMSFSGAEDSAETQTDLNFLTPAGHQGVTFIASTGDSSFPGGYPAVSPNVLAVGGTSLTINSDGSYGGESAWSGGGGNISDFEPLPSYQDNIASAYTTTQRLSPDVSWLADPNTGVVVIDSYGYPGQTIQVGGTSLATPMWAGLLSIVNQGRAAQGMPTLDTAQTHALLYSLPSSDFNDITTGSNIYPALPGYDVATGLGSPNVVPLVSDLTNGQALFVSANAPGPVHDGSSWQNAYASLQQALGAATSHTAILVAQGTYLPTSSTDPTATFQLASGVSLFGGWEGYQTPNPNLDLNPDASGAGFTTTLSGILGGGVANSYHVVTGSGVDSSAILDNFTITGGDADGAGTGQNNGGGLLDMFGSPSVAFCTFTADSAANFGGGVYNNGAPATFTACTFNGNSADQGGGDCSTTDTGNILDCTFINNIANTSGGGLLLALNSAATVANCVFTGNTTTGANSYGGGLFVSLSSATIDNCTFDANTSMMGGAVATMGGAGTPFGNVNAGFSNSIFWNDTATLSSSLNEFYLVGGDGPNPAVTNSDIQGGNPGAGNISVDPMFVNAPLDDFQLSENSPAIDAGSNGAVPAFVTTDGAGLARIDGTTVDIGAFEYETIYVDPTATTGTQSGGTWANAIPTLSAALNLAKWGQTIRVAQGTYYPTTGTDRTATFTLSDNEGVYGGYAGFSGVNPDARNITAFPTILSGDIGQPGVTTDNSYHVVSILTNITSNAVLDGFTITGGNADGSGDINSSIGAGIFEVDGGPTLNNLTVTNNQANGIPNDSSSEGYGAGMFCDLGFPTLTNCSFTNNTCTGVTAIGGGVLDENSGSEFVGCTFSNNQCTGSENEGGGFFSFQGSEILINCTLTNNTCTDAGYGAGAGVDSSSTEFVNCLFANNQAESSDPFSAGWGGGAFNFNNATPTYTNCTFSANTSDLGGAMASFTSSTITATNCIMYDDTDDFGYEFYINNDGSVGNITYSDVGDGTQGTGNIDADPQFVDAAAGNYQLNSTSPCVDKGNNAAINAAISLTGISTDLAGNQRIVNLVVDMGAYEAQTEFVTWTGKGDGHNWGNRFNWSDNQVPDQNNIVTIPAGFTVLVNGNFSVGQLTSSSPIEVEAGDSLKLYGNAILNGTLTIDNTGTVDIQANSVTINFAAGFDPVATIRGYLKTAYNGGVWTGTGLTSTTVEAQVANAIKHGGGVYAIGYADGSLDAGLQSVATGNQIVLEPEIVGDATLDGTDNFLDIGRVAQNLSKINTDWVHGDFNYDGTTNFLDLGLTAQNLNKSKVNTTLAATVPSGTTPAVIQSVLAIGAPISGGPSSLPSTSSLPAASSLSSPSSSDNSVPDSDALLEKTPLTLTARARRAMRRLLRLSHGTALAGAAVFKSSAMAPTTPSMAAVKIARAKAMSAKVGGNTASE